MFKLIRRVLLLLILLIAAGILFRNPLGAWVLARAIEKETGRPTHLGQLDLHLAQRRIVIRNLYLLNPWEDYRERRALHIRYLEAEFDSSFLLGKPIRIHRLVLDIPEIVATRNRGSGSYKLMESLPTRERKDSSRPSFLIDELVLSLGNILNVEESEPLPAYHLIRVNTHQEIFRSVNGFPGLEKIFQDLSLRNSLGKAALPPSPTRSKINSTPSATETRSAPHTHPPPSPTRDFKGH